MFFRNAQTFRLPVPWAITIDALDGQLAGRAFRPCGSQDMAASGFVAPCEHASHGLVHSVGGQWLVCLQVEQRLLPSSVVKQEAKDRAEKIAEEQGYKPGRKQMKEIREAVTQELMPRAFTQRRHVYAWIDPAAGWLVVDAASRGAAHQMIDALNKTLDEFPLLLLNTQRSPAAAMTEWLVANEAPGAFTIDQDCVLEALTDGAVRYTRHSLDGEDVRKHIESGKTVSSLALTFGDRISIVLNSKFELKRLQFLDIVKDSEADAQDAAEQFDSDFALMTAELGNFLPALVASLGGEVAA